MTPSAVLFDMDGLLIDSERIALRVFQEISDAHAVDHSFPLYAKLLGTNSTTTHTVLSNELPEHINVEDFIAQWSARYAEETQQPIPLMKGVVNLLNHLQDANVPVAVATSTRTDTALEKLEKSGILHRFLTVTGGDQVKSGKPAPDIYLKAAQSIRQPATSCLALEDSPNGVRAALAANMKTIQIPQLVPPDNITRSLGHTILEDLNAVIDYLQNDDRP